MFAYHLGFSYLKEWHVLPGFHKILAQKKVLSLNATGSIGWKVGWDAEIHAKILTSRVKQKRSWMQKLHSSSGGKRHVAPVSFPIFCHHSEIFSHVGRLPWKSLCTFVTPRRNAQCALHRSFTFCSLQRSGSTFSSTASFDRAKWSWTSREMDLDGPETSTHCRWSRAITTETCFWFA